MGFVARPVGTQADSWTRVEAGLPFVRINYGPKVIVRAAASVRFHRGSHGANGLVGPLVTEPVADVLHAPIRSRDDLDTRVAMGERVLALGEEPGKSWHLKRLVGKRSEALEAEWLANSVGFRPRAGFRPDLRLCWLGRRLRPFRRAMLAGANVGWTGEPARPVSEAARPVSV